MKAAWIALVCLTMVTAAVADSPDLFGQGETATVPDREDAQQPLPAADPAEPPTQALPEVSLADRLAAQSLHHSAMEMVLAPAHARARTGRLLTLGEAAIARDPRNVRALGLVADLYESMGRIEDAGIIIETMLQLRPSDAALAERWLTLAARVRHQAEDRLSLLGTVSASEQFPGPLRAVAAVGASQILMGQGQPDRAIRLLRQALEADPGNVEAIQALYALMQGPRPQTPGETRPMPEADRLEQIRAIAGVLASRPYDLSLAAQLASLLGDLGLYEPAADIYLYIWEIQSRVNLPMEHGLALSLSEALVDAGRYQQALEIFLPLLEELDDPDSPARTLPLRVELLEAARGTEQEDLARQLLAQIEALHARSAPQARRSPLLAQQLAWLYLTYVPDRQQALEYARLAIQAGEMNLRQIVTVSAAQLRDPDPVVVAEAENRLRQLAPRSAEAAWFLVRHYVEQGRRVTAERALTEFTSGRLSRRGWGFRQMRYLARRQGMTIPPAADASQAAPIYAQLREGALAVGLAPENHLQVELQAVSEQLTAGEPIEIRAVLRNIGQRPVRLGRTEGLLRPAVALEVRVSGTQELFDNLPLLTWPAPRYLQPGQEVTQTVRLDVGQLHRHLVMRPLDDLELTVRGHLDPTALAVEGTGARARPVLGSQLPTIEVAPLRIVRRSVLVDFNRDDSAAWPAAYQRSLGYIVRDMKQGELPERLRAARQVGSLLALAGEVRMAAAQVPSPLRGAFQQPVLLTMLREVLTDESPVVRAEMAKALLDVRLDRHVRGLVEAVSDDPSPLVRLRMAELIGVHDGRTGSRLMRQYEEDADPLVRQLARAFRQR